MEDVAVRAASPLRVWRYLSCIRYREIALMQGAPILGATFAFGNATPDKLGALIVFAAASVLLVAHIFALNDWAGVSADLNDPNKAPGVCLTKGISRRHILVLSIVLLAGSLLLFRILGGCTFVLASAIAALGLLYSAPAIPAKGVPLLSSVTHLVGGELHFLLGYAVFTPVNGRGMLIALFFALTVTAGHLNQEARDYDGDRLNGIRTNAVAFGRRRTFVAGLVVFSLAYGYLVALAACGVVPSELMVMGMLWPLHLYWSLKTMTGGLTFQSISRLQASYHALYAIIGVSMLASLLLGR
jgi:4-hydroxybenzoate polyprenyltransferase